MNQNLSKLLILSSIIILSFLGACEIINPSEQIPSYIQVDTLKVKINSPTEGTSIHSISDCWLYVNSKLVGVFEVPFKIPVLESGMQNISIEPGIKNSGSDSDRGIYPMMYSYNIDTLLTEAGVLILEPEFSYRPVVFDLIEDFEDIGIEFERSAQSDTGIILVSGSQAQQGKSMYFALDDERKKFEARSSRLFEIEKQGKAYLEISFKATDSFTFGIFSLEFQGASMMEVRKQVYNFNPTETWRRVYIDLNYFVNNVNGSEFRLYFTCVRPENASSEKTEVYIDNVKLLYLSLL